MKKATLRFTTTVNSTVYVTPSWWAFDDYGFAIAGGYTTKRALLSGLAEINRRVKSGLYSRREMYTGY